MPESIFAQPVVPMAKKGSSTNGGPSNTVDEINYRCEAKERKMHLKYYLEDDERRELIGTKGIAEAGCLLFEYYLRLAAKGDLDASDSRAAWHFGWQPQKVQRLRLNLTNEGWFRQARSKYSDGRKAVTYYVGREAVSASQVKSRKKKL